MTWQVGDTEILAARWYLNGTEITTGTAEAFLSVSNAGSTQWVDDDLSTLSGTRNGLALAYSADDGWVLQFTVPTTLKGHNVYVEYVHSDTTLPQLTEEDHYVTDNDLDDVYGAASAVLRPGAGIGAE